MNTLITTLLCVTDEETVVQRRQWPVQHATAAVVRLYTEFKSLLHLPVSNEEWGALPWPEALGAIPSHLELSTAGEARGA